MTISFFIDGLLEQEIYSISLSKKTGAAILLVRIYETKNQQLVSSISEYTNSQNPVASRDLRSKDYMQRKIEADLQTYGYYYDRKKGLYAEYPKQKVIDAEKAAQAIMALILGKPAEAKDEKRLIFSDRYDEIFSDSLTAEQLLVSYLLYKEVESIKLAIKREIAAQPEKYQEQAFILHASYFIVYSIGVLAHRKGLKIAFEKIKELKDLYLDAVSAVKKAVNEERHSEGVKYQHRMFFKSSKAKSKLDVFLFGDREAVVEPPETA